MSTKIFYSIAGIFLLFSITMFLFPQIDLAISGFFYQPQRGFLLTQYYESFHLGIFRDVLVYITSGFIILLTLLLIIGVLFKNLTLPVQPKVCLFLLLCFAIAPILVVNGVFKNHWGRARPHQVQQFGGNETFTPAWVIGTQCQTNCSFPSGETANVFCYLALLFVVRRKTLIATIVLTIAFLTAFERIGQGDHFFSDTMISGLIDYLLIWLIYQACHPKELFISTIGANHVSQP